MIEGMRESLIFLESSTVEAKLKFGHSRGDPYCAISRLVLIAVLFGVIEKNLDRLDRHRTIGEDRDARDLSSLHHLFQNKKELLRSFHREGWNHHTAASFDRLSNRGREVRAGIGEGVLTVAVGRLHYHQVGSLSWRRPRRHRFPGSQVLVADAPDISGKQQAPRLAV